MIRTKFVILALALAAITLAGCSTAGSVVQGVGSAFNKTGGVIKGIGH